MYANPRAQFYDWSVIAVPLVYLAGEILRAQQPVIATWSPRNLVSIATLMMVVLTAATTHSWLLAWNPSLLVPLVVLAAVGLWSFGCAEQRPG
jgi:hypothetical protein